MNQLPPQLDLRDAKHVAILEALCQEKNLKLKGPDRKGFLLRYGWRSCGRRLDGITEDWCHPRYTRRGIPVVLNASAAIRFQVYLNLVSAGAIRDRSLETILNPEEPKC